MSEFEKNQIKRQTINDQLPLKLINYLDYQQNLIQQSFTTKSRFILPKSEQKVFHVDDQFASAFTQLTLDQKVTYYSKQITILKQLLDPSGVTFNDNFESSNKLNSFKCKVKGKGLGIQWQELAVSVCFESKVMEIPLKLGLYKVDLHDYLVRESMDQQQPQIVLDAIRPNIIKYWRLAFQNEQEYQSAVKLLTAVADAGLRKRLQDDIRNFQQLRVTSKSTLRKKPQMELTKQSIAEASKFSSQVIEINNNNHSLWQDKLQNKKMVNFQNQNHVKMVQPRDETSIIDVLSTQFRAASPSIDYQRPDTPNLFDGDQDWFIRIMAQGYICSSLYDGVDPNIVLNDNTSFKSIYQKDNNLILQHNKNPRCFKIQTKLRFPKDLVLSAICEVEKWNMWNKAVEAVCVKLRVPNSNLIVCQMRMKQLNYKYRPRQFLFMLHFFNKNNEWYLMITSIKDSYHPVTQEDTIRAKISRCIIRIRESKGLTQLELMIDMKQFGDLNPSQQAELTQKFLFGMFDLEPCLQDRIFVEAKASKYFDLDWSCEKFSRFTLGKNNDLDQTSSFTSNLCSEIGSFYSAEGPEDYEDFQQFALPMIPTSTQMPHSFMKKKQGSKVGNIKFSQVQRDSERQLPFSIPIQNNKVILDESTKQKIQRYIREKQAQRLMKGDNRNFERIISSRKNSEQIPRAPSKLPLPTLVEVSPKAQAPSLISSYKEMKEVINSNKALRQTPMIPRESSHIDRRQTHSNFKSSVAMSNMRNSHESYNILPQKKQVSRIEIDKFNPDDHIIPYWEPKIYPDTGQSILSAQYIEKWVSMDPINVKKVRMYKGDNWDHFLFRDLWTVTQTGELKCINQQKLNAQSSAIKLVLKRFASNVMSGKGILNVSLPVEIFSELSCLELIARSLCFAPYLLEQAAKMDSPLERFKIANVFSIATSLLYIEMEKPFNPILGETYQGWIAGCPIYCEQISHHPPISAFYLVGRGYTVSGRLEPTIDLSLNSGVGWNEGQFTIQFSNYPGFVIKTQSPPGEITGLAYGDRKLNFTSKSYAYDNSGLFCEFIFNPTKKGMLSFGKQEKESDYMKGSIVRVDPSFIKKYKAASSKKRESPSNKQIIEKICDAEGRWTVGLSFGGVEYFNVMRDQPSMLEHEKYPLNSHCNYREDIYYRRRQNFNLAQSHKERLEVLQRNDKKLRQRDSR